MKAIHLTIATRIGSAGLLLLLFACESQPTLQIARIPFASPVVVPSLETGAFIITAAVKNWGDRPTQPGKLGLTVWYQCHSCGDFFGYGWNNDILLFDFPALAPGQGWTPIKDQLIAQPGRVSAGCFKDDCTGQAILTLFDQAGSRITGQNTNLVVFWDRSGDLASMKIFEWP
jgi:hypothetical protein